MARALLALVFAATFALAGCGSNNEANNLAISNDVTYNETVPPQLPDGSTGAVNETNTTDVTQMNFANEAPPSDTNQ
jgi:hypothetical protein